MKKLLIILVFVGSVLSAAYTKQDRIHDMQEMAHAMNTIQSGFFYNNFETVAEGVEHLSSAMRRVRPPMEELAEEDIMAKYMNNKVRMTNKVIKKINKKTLTILQRYKAGDSAQAIQAYSKILDQCMKCHRETRNW